MSTQRSIPETLPSESVIQRIADRKGVDPLDLNPLFYAIEPDALDALVRAETVDASTLQIEFTYHGYDVTVTGDGDVHVDGDVTAVSTDP